LARRLVYVRHEECERRITAYILQIVCLSLLTAVAIPAQKPDAFPLGVAAGEVTPFTAVVWTRTSQPDGVRLEVSTDPTIKGQDAFHMTVVPSAETDFTLKIQVTGLSPVLYP
jgi:phosphodiesterase/alkaline phosphatase D-like protein